MQRNTEFGLFTKPSRLFFKKVRIVKQSFSHRQGQCRLDTAFFFVFQFDGTKVEFCHLFYKIQSQAGAFFAGIWPRERKKFVVNFIFCVIRDAVVEKGAQIFSAAGQGRVIQRVGSPSRKVGRPPGSESLEADW